jgi:hypothetical protein
MQACGAGSGCPRPPADSQSRTPLQGGAADTWSHKRLIVAQGLVEALAAKLGVDGLDVVATFKGSALEGCTYTHPIYGRSSPVVVGGDYITTDSGTGLVHTAPGHGQEDYQVGAGWLAWGGGARVGVPARLWLSCVRGPGSFLRCVRRRPAPAHHPSPLAARPPPGGPALRAAAAVARRRRWALHRRGGPPVPGPRRAGGGPEGGRLAGSGSVGCTSAVDLAASDPPPHPVPPPPPPRRRATPRSSPSCRAWACCCWRSRTSTSGCPHGREGGCRGLGWAGRGAWGRGGLTRPPLLRPCGAVGHSRGRPPASNRLAAPPPAPRYPYDWRTKKPTIFRATDQWFASVEGFRWAGALRAGAGGQACPAAPTAAASVRRRRLHTHPASPPFSRQPAPAPAPPPGPPRSVRSAACSGCRLSARTASRR